MRPLSFRANIYLRYNPFRLLNSLSWVLLGSTVLLTLGVQTQASTAALSNSSSAASLTPLSEDCQLPQALPIPTHWKIDTGFTLGASDQYPINNPLLGEQLKNDDKIKYVYNFNILPNTDFYIGENFSIKSISDSTAQSILTEFCESTKQAYQLWKPSSYNGADAIQSILTSAPRSSGVVQIITGLTINKSMFAVILPAHWTPPTISRPAPYPIVFNGFYDLNDNLFQLEGATMTSLIAQSVKANSSGRMGTGAIGILWNGAGAIASRTTNPGAYDEFQAIVDLVAKLGGDPHRIIGFGVSRGGITALQMASNPNPHNYTFRYVYAAVPPGHIGSIAAMASPTVPQLMAASDWSSGLADSYKLSFIYPQVGNDLTGLDGREAHVKILTGTKSLKVADELYSLGSSNLINALKQSGTQVYLEISSHDFIVPAFDQLWLYHQYKNAEIPLELRFNYLAGHHTDTNQRNKILAKALKNYTHKYPLNHPHVNSGAKNFFKVDEDSKQLVPLKKPKWLFTLELPRYVSPETKGIIVATGKPRTQFEIQFSDSNNNTISLDAAPTQSLNEFGFSIIDFDPKKIPTGILKLKSVRIKKTKSGPWKTLDLNHRSYMNNITDDPNNDPMIIENLAEHPKGMSGGQFTEFIFQGYLGDKKEKIRGKFNGVSYGIIETE